MRIRTIKPEFWQSEELGNLPREARMLAAALLNWADDEGYFRSHPALIAGSLLPFDPDGQRFVAHAMPKLAEVGFVELYEGGVGKVANFSAHQKINRPSPSKLRTKASEKLTEVSVRPHGGVTEESEKIPLEVEQGSGTGNREVECETPPPQKEIAVVVTPPDTSPEVWTGEDFWRWAQSLRQEAGFVAETRRPRGLGAWYSQALGALNGDVERLQEAFYRFGESKYWQERDPPLPFAGFISQWAQFVPRKAHHAAQ